MEINCQYLTICGKSDGLGAQTNAKFSGLAFCELHNLTYVHSPFKRISHGFNAADVATAEAFFGLGSGELQISDSSISHGSIEKHKFMAAVVYSRTPDKFYTSTFRRRLRAKYNETEKPALPFLPGKFNVCMHIRRGDVRDKPLYKGRYTPDEKNLEMISKIQALFPGAMIYIFSEGQPKRFSQYKRLPNVRMCLNQNVFTTFHAMVSADMFVPARSAFSYCAALLSEGVVVRDGLAGFLTFQGRPECLPLNSWQSLDQLSVRR